MVLTVPLRRRINNTFSRTMNHRDCQQSPSIRSVINLEFRSTHTFTTRQSHSPIMILTNTLHSEGLLMVPSDNSFLYTINKVTTSHLRAKILITPTRTSSSPQVIYPSLCSPYCNLKVKPSATTVGQPTLDTRALPPARHQWLRRRSPHRVNQSHHLSRDRGDFLLLVAAAHGE